MALWGGLGQTATVAQLVGVDVGGLVSMIMHAALTARQNKRECEQLARRVFMIGELLPHLQDSSVMRRPEVRRPLMLLGGMLREAHELVASCQGRSTVYQLVAAGRQAEKFRDIQRRIDSYLLLFPFISHIDITRRLDRIHREMIPSDHPKPTSLPSPSTGSQNHEAVVIQDVVIHGGEAGEKINLAGLAAATNNFAPDREIGKGGFSTVYMTRLPDGREVAIKRIDSASMEEDTLREATMLPSLRHEHIIRLFGWVSVRKKQHRQQPFWKKRKGPSKRISPAPLHPRRRHRFGHRRRRRGENRCRLRIRIAGGPPPPAPTSAATPPSYLLHRRLADPKPPHPPSPRRRHRISHRMRRRGRRRCQHQ
ncbi:hypothetical protein DAI22_11g225700 [Oryza sativa Japonica Group]|nr:hypothetical protein DAI22_11g225700 [Oryza sativa Japonica Group]